MLKKVFKFLKLFFSTLNEYNFFRQNILQYKYCGDIIKNIHIKKYINIYKFNTNAIKKFITVILVKEK